MGLRKRDSVLYQERFEIFLRALLGMKTKRVIESGLSFATKCLDDGKIFLGLYHPVTNVATELHTPRGLFA